MLKTAGFLWSRALWTNPLFLWLMVLSNAAGTVYGYIWYGKQMEYTLQFHPFWRIVFVPDSPTASLFFTLSLLFLIFPVLAKPNPFYIGLRSIIEALGVVTSIKYGIWAVTMIAAGAAQGDPLEWQHYMLIVSHLAMAVEALIYIRFLVFGRFAAFLALLWLLLNDTMDYTYFIYPWLPDVLENDLPAIQSFSMGLSVVSVLATWLFISFRKV